MAVYTCASPSISYILSCWSPSRARGHSARLVRDSLFASSTFSLQGRFFFLFVFIPRTLHPIPYSVSCQDSEVQKHASFFTSSPFWYRQKLLLWNSLSACSLAWTSLMSDCSLFLAWTRRSGDGFARQMQLCVREKVKWHKKAVSVSRWDGESQHYANVKSIKNKSLHAENNEFMVLKWQLIFGRIGKTGGKVLVVVIKNKNQFHPQLVKHCSGVDGHIQIFFPHFFLYEKGKRRGWKCTGDVWILG